MRVICKICQPGGGIAASLRANFALRMLTQEVRKTLAAVKNFIAAVVFSIAAVVFRDFGVTLPTDCASGIVVVTTRCRSLREIAISHQPFRISFADFANFRNFILYDTRFSFAFTLYFFAKSCENSEILRNSANELFLFFSGLFIFMVSS